MRFTSVMPVGYEASTKDHPISELEKALYNKSYLTQMVSKNGIEAGLFIEVIPMKEPKIRYYIKDRVQWEAGNDTIHVSESRKKIMIIAEKMIKDREKNPESTDTAKS